MVRIKTQTTETAEDTYWARIVVAFVNEHVVGVVPVAEALNAVVDACLEATSRADEGAR